MLNTIRVRRYKTKQTQEDLARVMKVRTGTINSIENGQTIPNLKLAMRIARYYKVHVDELFQWEAEDDLDDNDVENPGLI